MRYLFFEQTGVIADLQGIACFKVQEYGSSRDVHDGSHEVVLCSQACYAQAFIGGEDDAHDFLARLARTLGAVAVPAQADGGSEDERRPDGITDKYLVRKADGTPTDPSACYFVLRYDTDPHARAALYAYASSASHDRPKLATDLLAALTATAPARQSAEPTSPARQDATS